MALSRDFLLFSTGSALRRLYSTPRQFDSIHRFAQAIMLKFSIVAQSRRQAKSGEVGSFWRNRLAAWVEDIQTRMYVKGAGGGFG